MPSPMIADETVFLRQKHNLTEPPILLPITESEFVRRRTTENGAARSREPTPINSDKLEPMSDTDELAPVVESNSKIHRLEHVETGPHVSTMPGDQAAIPSLKSSKKKSLVITKGIVICATLGLATVVAIGGNWPRTLTENFKSYISSGISKMTSADSAKTNGLARAMLATTDETVPDVTEIAHQLDTLARDLFFVQQNIQELAAGQEQIRKVQEQLAETQSNLAVAQAKTNPKQNKRPTFGATEGQKSKSRNLHYIWR